jgi:hypothetical protein
VQIRVAQSNLFHFSAPPFSLPDAACGQKAAAERPPLSPNSFSQHTRFGFFRFHRPSGQTDLI